MEKLTLISLFKLGGWAMWPLLVMSIITVAVTVERAIYFLMSNFKTSDIEPTVLELLQNNEIDKAMEYLNSFPKNKLIVGIINEGLKKAPYGEHRMEKCLEAETQEQVKIVEKGLHNLVEMSALAPITGFLGTVSGMIGAFSAIAKASDVNAQLVAGGIFEALITTAYGLIIAVVAIASYNFFTTIIERFISKVERIGTDIVDIVVMNELKK
jgi:biopolymer transport protein ExbB